MTTSITHLHEKLIGYLHEGKFTEGIEDFYAEDVCAQENGNAPRSGRDALASAEREYLTGVTRYDGMKVLGTAIDDQGNGNGTVFYEAEMNWHHLDDGDVHVQQAVVERWENCKVKSVRFYGTFVP